MSKLDNNLLVQRCRQVCFWFPSRWANDSKIEANSIVADPLFKDVANMDLTLDPASPAITQLGFVPLDVNLDSFGVKADYPAHLLAKDSRLTQWGEKTTSVADAHIRH